MQSMWTFLLLLLAYSPLKTTAFQPGSLVSPFRAIASPLFRSSPVQGLPPIVHGSSQLQHEVVLPASSLRHTADDVPGREIKHSKKNIFRSLLGSVYNQLKKLRRRVVAVAFTLALVLCTHVSMANAVSGGRSGGSFGPSSRSRAPISRPMRSRPPMRTYAPMRPTVVIHSGPRFSAGTTQWALGNTATRPVNRLSPSEITVLTATGSILLYGYMNNKDRLQRGPNSPLGPGATMASVTVALNVPNRDDRTSVLHTLRKISLRSDTSTRKGVQNLISEMALELLRQEKSMVSAYTESDHFPTTGLADRAFQSQSIRSRSKFDRELVNKFGGQNRPDEPSEKDQGDGAKATKAVVTLNLAIEGDSTVLSKINSRQDLLNVLSQIASDVQVEDCLLSGEVLWSPEGPGEILTNDDLYADYPNLIPL